MLSPEPAERAVLDRIAGRGTEIVNRAVAWAEINSGSRNYPGLERQREALEPVLARLPGMLRRMPLRPTVEIDAGGREAGLTHPDALLLTVRPEAPVQAALTGHYDTVYSPDSPFQQVSTRSDGALVGPGIADMKGGLSVMLAALEAFETFEGREALGYRVLLSPDEEIGSPASAPLLAELGAGAHVGLTYEPALGDGALAAARKGSGNFHVLIRGRAAHAGRDFGTGRNAVGAAARLGAYLDGLNGKREGVTINIARIDGGGPLNVVPDAAVLRFNIRAPEPADLSWAEWAVGEAVREINSQGVTAEVFGGFTRPPKPFKGAQQSLFEAIAEAGRTIGQQVSWRPSGGVCEGNNLFAAGAPNADSLGVCGGDIHSSGEYAWPASFAERAQLSAMILMRLATGVIDGPAIKARLAGERGAAGELKPG
ncbi:MAG TPA: hydrolase [Caulobacteraceae bacterium]|jgi:glutamate carboxypeptidase